MPEIILSIDIETYSSADLGKTGVYKYCEAPDFQILLFAYAFDDDEVEIIDMANGEKLPQKVIDAIHDPTIIKAAWNAQFERTCLSHYFGHQLEPDSWRCSMVLAASLSLPLSLKHAAEALGTEEQKDKSGVNLIQKFSRAKKDAHGNYKQILPSSDPKGWETFKSYCKQDVRTERDIRKELERYPMTDLEWKLYAMDQRINDRGVLIDEVLANQAIMIDLTLSDEMTQQAYELTDLDNPNSVSQLKMWLEERGIHMPSLGKKEVADMIEQLTEDKSDEEALKVLTLRLRMAKSSVKKYQAAIRGVCKDGRVRGLFQFYGANRTGRWCLAEGSLILVKEPDGTVRKKCIENVTKEDQVWDGTQWVHHDGVVYSGEKEVITWDGVTASPEHQVFLDEITSIPLSEARERGIPIWRGSEPMTSSMPES